MGKDIFDRSILLQQFDSCLFTNAFDTRNIVTAVSHEGFHIDDLQWFNTHVLFHLFRGHDIHIRHPLLH